MTTNLAPKGNVAQFTVVDRTPDARWFIDFMDRANTIPEYAVIREALAVALRPTPDGVVLDIGCGTGEDALELAARPEVGRVFGTDLSAAMVEEARRRAVARGLDVRFRTSDASSLDLPDGAVDGVRAKLVLMHCADVDAVAAEMVRVVRPGGRIAVYDYDFETSTIDHPDKATTREIVRCLADGHANSWGGRQLRRRFLDLGLTDVTVDPYTVSLPYTFFRMSVSGRLEQARAEGALALSADALRRWWDDLAEAESNDRFFATLTGFLLAGTR